MRFTKRQREKVGVPTFQQRFFRQNYLTSDNATFHSRARRIYLRPSNHIGLEYYTVKTWMPLSCLLFSDAAGKLIVGNV